MEEDLDKLNIKEGITFMLNDDNIYEVFSQLDDYTLSNIGVTSKHMHEIFKSNISNKRININGITKIKLVLDNSNLAMLVNIKFNNTNDDKIKNDINNHNILKMINAGNASTVQIQGYNFKYVKDLLDIEKGNPHCSIQFTCDGYSVSLNNNTLIILSGIGINHQPLNQ